MPTFHFKGGAFIIPMRRIVASLRRFSKAEKRRENAFLTLPAAGQSADYILSATPYAYSCRWECKQYATNKLSPVCFQQSLVRYFSSLREQVSIYNVVFNEV